MRNTSTRFFVSAVSIVCVGLLLILSGGSAAQEKPQKDKPKKDKPKAEKPLTDKTLQGVWRGERFESGKGDTPGEGVKLELAIKDNGVKGTRLPEGKAIAEGTIKLSKDGKQIEATGTTGGFKDKKYLGIIKLDGDTLYWCTTSGGKTQERPTEFVASSSKGTYLIVVKREKPGKP